MEDVTGRDDLPHGFRARCVRLTALLLIAAASLAIAPRAIAAGFRETQLAAPRVRAAHTSRGEEVRKLFVDHGFKFPPKALLIRIFKDEDLLELWGRRDGTKAYELVTTFPVCARSGRLGPKRRRGDLQVPEGFYHLNHFNPRSNFHLSLGVSYPNASDRILGKKGDLGDAIYIHGSCVTIGCIPIEDDGIEVLYLAALEAHAAGQAQIPIHIFPTRMDAKGMERLARIAAEDPDLLAFWTNLQEGYDWFEKNRRPPGITVDKAGRYRFPSAGASASVR